MSKGLEALRRIKPHLEIIDGEDGEMWGTGEYEEEEALEIIEKELEAFAVINKYFYSKHIIHDLYCLGATDEEINQVKEVLK